MAKTRAAVLVALMLMLAFVLAGCGGGNTDPAELEGTWNLKALGGTSDLTDADPAIATNIVFKAKDSSASGSGGVNSFSTTYVAADDGSLSFGPIAGTMKAGEPAAMEQEQAFFDALASTASFELNSSDLVLSDVGNNTVAVLVRR